MKLLVGRGDQLAVGTLHRSAHRTCKIRNGARPFALSNHPYKVEIAQGEWTCTVADFTVTMRGPMKGSDGKLTAPTNKKFHIEFCTVAHWKNGEIVEEKLFYDLVGLLKQIGVM